MLTMSEILRACDDDNAHGAVWPLVGAGQQTARRVVQDGAHLQAKKGLNRQY